MTVVAVVGDVLADVVVRPSGPIQQASDTPSAISWKVGGAAANVALALSDLGQPARLVGRIGRDPMGDALLDALTRPTLEPWLTRSSDHATGTVVALVRDAERDMLTDRGASGALSADDLVEGWLADVAHVHVSGYTLLSSRSRSAGLAALAAARAAGLPVSVDPASASPLQRLGADAFLGLLGCPTGGAPTTDAPAVEGPVLLTPNAEEAQVLTALADPVAAARALGARTGESVVTLGPHGVLWSDGRRHLHHPSPQVDGPVNPVGAGDAFVAGLLAARLAGAAIVDQLAAGTDAAARVVQGGRPRAAG